MIRDVDSKPKNLNVNMTDHKLLAKNDCCQKKFDQLKFVPNP